MLAPWKKRYDKSRHHIKKQRYCFANKSLSNQMIPPVVMYGCESWTLKKAECRRIDAFEFVYKTLESSLDSSEIKPVNPKRNQP